MPSRRRALVVIVVLAWLAAVWPASAVSPTVAISTINGSSTSSGLTPVVAGKTLTATGSAETMPAPIADAGDSAFVRLGETADLTGSAWRGTQPYRFSWTFQGSASRFSAPTSNLTHFDTSGLALGKQVVTLTVTDDRGQTAADTVQLFVYDDTPQVLSDQSYDSIPGALGVVSDAHHVAVPSGLAKAEFDLTWTQHLSTPGVSANDYDLYVTGPDGTPGRNDTAGATGNPSEAISVDRPAGGDWLAEVDYFLTTGDTYRLRVLGTPTIDNPVPQVTTSGPFTFTEGDPQHISAAVSGGAGPLDVEWDLDADGVYDTPGLAVDTAFGLGSHFVGVKVVDSAGYEKREITVVRIVEPTQLGQTAPIVTVGVADTGINPYHDDFSAATYPDPRVLELTNGFTRYPGEYIAGYPANVPALNINRDTDFTGLFPPSDAGIWTRGNIPLHSLRWIPGTKIIGAIDSSDTAPVNGQADTTPLLDDDGHGTHSSSVAVGNIYGFCPTCLLVFSEGLDASWFYQPQQKWIDITSNSYGALANAPDPLAPGVPDFPKVNAERGQLALYAAGNGNENGFVTPEQTYTSNTLGPEWSIRVGAVNRANRQPIVGTGKPVDVASFGFGDIPAASRTGRHGTEGHDGTSAATPYTAGAFGTVLTKIRDALGDAGVGQRGSDTDGLIAVGNQIPASPYLSDGRLTRSELVEAVLKSAAIDDADPDTIGIYPTTTPPNPYQYLLEGYGVVDALGPDTTDARAVKVLMGEATLPSRPDEDDFFANDAALRSVLWGGWNGGGPNSAHTVASVSPLGPLAGVTKASVPTIDAALGVLDAAFGPLSSGAASVAFDQQRRGEGTAFYLHRSPTCATASITTGNSVGDGDGCPVGGPTGFSSRPVTRSWPAGTPVNGVVFVRPSMPAHLDLTSALLADGSRVGASAMKIDLTAGTARLFPTRDGYVGLPVSLTTTAPIPVGSTVTLTLAPRSAVPLGLEGGHASFFVLGGAGAGTASTDPSLQVAIATPAAGATLDPGRVASLTVSGSSTLPVVQPGPSAVRFYPRRFGGQGCSATTFLSKVDGSDELCTPVNAVVPFSYTDSFPLKSNELPLKLDGPATGRIWMLAGVGASPVEQITVALTTIEPLTGAKKTIASQSVQGAVVTDQALLSGTPAEDTPLPKAVPFDFAMDIDQSYLGTSLSALGVDLTIDITEGGSGWSLDDPASYIDLPVVAAPGVAPGSRVEVGLDDPNLSSFTLATIGSDASWSTTVDATRLSDGPHTVYVRAADGTRSASASRAFTVEWSTNPVPGTVEVQVVTATGTPSSTKWVAVTDTSANGDFSSWTAQLSVKNLKPGSYRLFARVTKNGTEVATTSALFQRK